MSKPARKTAADPKRTVLQRIESFPHAVLTVNEVVELLRISPSFVRNLIEEGSLEAIDVAGRYATRKYYRILKESLVACVKQKRAPEKLKDWSLL